MFTRAVLLVPQPRAGLVGNRWTRQNARSVFSCASGASGAALHVPCVSFVPGGATALEGRCAPFFFPQRGPGRAGPLLAGHRFCSCPADLSMLGGCGWLGRMLASAAPHVPKPEAVLPPWSGCVTALPHFLCFLCGRAPHPECACVNFLCLPVGLVPKCGAQICLWEFFGVSSTRFVLPTLQLGVLAGRVATNFSATLCLCLAPFAGLFLFPRQLASMCGSALAGASPSLTFCTLPIPVCAC